MPDELPERAELSEAFRRYHAGDWPGTVDACRQLVERYPQSARGWHLWGLAEFRRNAPSRAIELIEQAISLDASQAHFFNHLGAALEALGRMREALARFQRAAGIDPEYTEAHANCAAIYERLQQPAAAEAALRRACSCSPERNDLRCRWARMLVDVGRRGEAIDMLRASANAAPPPQRAELEALLGDLLREADELTAAIDAYETALRLAPDMAEVLYRLGQAHANQGHLAQARVALERAMQLRPDKRAWRLQAKLLTPSVFASAEEIEHFQAQLLLELNAGDLDASLGSRGDLVAAGICPPFGINFQGRQTRSIKERLATLVRGPQPLARPKARSGKPRIGFVVTAGHEGLFLRCTGGIVDRLEREEFEIFVIASASCLPFLRRRLASPVTFVSLSARYDQAAEILQRTACDLLYHWEIGSDAMNYLLPMARAAAVQCTSWGTQVTSGLAEVDYYLSSHWIERADADDDYAEALVRLESLPTWQRRVPAPPATNKVHFGWSENRRIYLCPQNLLKIHPDQDPLFANILDADAEALLVLKQSRSPELVRQLQARSEVSLGAAARRVVWLPWLSMADYYRLVSVADVVLDPVHYSAGSSCYDMLSLCQPVVTLPGQRNVGRFTQACYRYMGFEELIAEDAESYVRIALRVAQDEAYRRHVREQLSDRGSALFEDDRAVAAHATFFREAIQRAREER